MSLAVLGWNLALAINLVSGTRMKQIRRDVHVTLYQQFHLHVAFQGKASPSCSRKEGMLALNGE
jgi:hypothetical protein